MRNSSAGAVAVILLAAAFAGGVLSGCSALYWENRASDLGDVMEANVGGVAFTSNFRIPSFLLSVQATRVGHLAVGNAATIRAGLYGGRWSIWTESGAALPVAPFAYFSREGAASEAEREDWQYAFYDRWDYLLFIPTYYRDVWSYDLDDALMSAKMETAVHWTDVAVDVVPLFFAVRIGVSPGELADFLLGWFCVDIGADDQLPDAMAERRLRRMLRRAETGGTEARRRVLLVAHRHLPLQAAWDVFRAATDWTNVRHRGMAFFLIRNGNWAPSDALPIMVRFLRDPDVRLRAGALTEIARMGSEAAVALPAVIVLLEGEGPLTERVHAARVLAEVAAASDVEVRREAGRVLGRHLNDADKAMRDTCYGALARVGREAAAEAIPALIERLKSQDTEERLEAVTMLGAIGPAARTALPALRAIKNDPSKRVQRRVERVIERLEQPSAPPEAPGAP